MDKQIIDITQKNEFTDCQGCGFDLRNGPVDKVDRKYMGSHIHYSKLVGLKMDPQVDIITHWQCPNCNFTFPRFS